MQHHRISCQPWRTVPALLVIVATLTVIVQAQTSPETQATQTPTGQTQTSTENMPATQSASTTDKLILKEGTEVKLVFAQQISSKTAHEDDPVELTLAEDLSVGGVVVAKMGSRATATVTNAKRAGMMGRGGELNIRLEHMKVGDTKVKLRGSKGRQGDDRTGTAVALTVLFGPIGLIKHGKEIDVKEGTPLTAYVDDDTPLTPVR